MEEPLIYEMLAKRQRQRKRRREQQKRRKKQLGILLGLIVIGIVVLSIMSFANTSSSYDDRKLEELMTRYETVDVMVFPGDTAWVIQRNLTPNEDIREILYYVGVINNKRSMGNLQAGEIVTFFQSK